MASQARLVFEQRDEPGVPLGPIVVVLIVCSLGLALGLRSGDGGAYNDSAHVLVSLLSIIGGFAWILEQWRPHVACWFVVLALVLLVYQSGDILPVAGLWALTVVPPAMALVLLGPCEAVLVGTAQTLWPIAATQLASNPQETGEILIALVAQWAVLGLMYALYRYHHDSYAQLYGHYERATEARENAELGMLRLGQTATALENAGRQLLVANERIASLRTIAEDAERTKALFVAKVSHEFRTPLNMIIGLAELMLETPEIYAVALPPTMRHDLAVILRNCRHLSSMIGDVLDLTRVETGRVMLRKERVDLAEIIAAAVTAVSPLVDKKGLELNLAAADDLPLVYCDRARIRQVVLNLVSNAARYTESGSITISAATSGEHVVVHVADTGPGIAAEDLERIFEPFTQASSAMWSDEGGSGLGLSISQQFIRLHQGRMWVESELGAGSTFSFEVPVTPPVHPVTRPSRWIREDWIWREDAFRSNRGGLADQARRARVIVYDGAGGLLPEVRRYAEEIDVVQVSSADEITGRLESEPADLVLVNEDDVQVLLPLVGRVASAVDRIPVVGSTVPLRTRRAAVLGATDYLLKPVTREQLQEALESLAKRPTSVLVVEDDLDARELFTRMRHTCDEMLRVETAASGEEALTRLSEDRFDLVLLDVILPGMNGWEIAERMQHDGGESSPPIVFVSAQDPADDPPRSRHMVVTLASGLNVSQLLRSALEMSRLLLAPGDALGRG